MSRALTVTGNHIMYDSTAWFLRVIMSSLRAFCSLPSVKKEKHDFYCNFRLMYNKTVIRFGFCGIENNQGLGKSYQAQPRLRLITPISTLIILDTTKTSSNNLVNNCVRRYSFKEAWAGFITGSILFCKITLKLHRLRCKGFDLKS